MQDMAGEKQQSVWLETGMGDENQEENFRLGAGDYPSPPHSPELGIRGWTMGRRRGGERWGCESWDDTAPLAGE